VVLPFYNGPEEEGRKKFKAFLDVGPVADLMKMLPYEEQNSLQVCACSSSFVTGATRGADMLTDGTYAEPDGYAR
jgi:hypothetical protein